MIDGLLLTFAGPFLEYFEVMLIFFEFWVQVDGGGRVNGFVGLLWVQQWIFFRNSTKRMMISRFAGSFLDFEVIFDVFELKGPETG